MQTLTEKAKYKERVVLVYQDAATGKVVRIIEEGPNIVTDAGDKFYARRGAGETVNTNSFPFHEGNMVVARSMSVTGASKKTATFGRFIGMASTYTGRKSFESGYPKTADSDANNTARTADGITYKRIYTTSQANYTIGAVGVCRNGATTNSSGQLLAAKTLPTASKVVKTSALTLTVYITHVFNGV
jgi:hypothetical protein